MLGVVKDEDLGARRFSGQQLGILRHVTSTVNLTLVIHLDLNFNFSGDRTKAAEF
jgi:hypothetical protein